MKKKIFIDGSAGTTGLLIHQQIKKIKNIQVVKIAIKNKKNINNKKKIYSQVDLVILCLPDEAARKAIKHIKKAKILDCSSAHRTNSKWVYGFPELKGQEEKIKTTRFVSNPGCYSIAFIAVMKPLIDLKIIKKSFTPYIWGVSGYTGGGKKLIKQFEKKNNSLTVPFLPYSLKIQHKHIKEMKLISKLKTSPVFLPSVISIPRGLMVAFALSAKEMKRNKITVKVIIKTLKQYYSSSTEINIFWIKDVKLLSGKFLNITQNISTNKIDIIICNNGQDVILISLIDNLGKGASLNALKNIKLMLGL